MFLVLISGCVQQKTEQNTIPITSITTADRSTTTLTLEDDSNRYVNREYGFSIVSPEGWTVDEVPEEQIVVSFVGPEETGFSYIEVRVMRLPNEISLAEFTEASKQDNANQLIFISERDRNINGITAHEFVSTNKATPNIQFKQVAMIEKGNLYVIITGASKDKYNSYDPLFEKSIETFKIK